MGHYTYPSPSPSPSPSPNPTQVSASTDGEWWGPTEAVYTYYDPAHAPVVSRVEPPYGGYLSATSVVLHGSNFAPTGSALVVRWGDLHSEPLPATFVSSDKVLAVTPALLDTHSYISLRNGMIVGSKSVPVDVSTHGDFAHRPPPNMRAEASAAALFTYYNPIAPPVIEASAPHAGHCGVGGAQVFDRRTHARIEVADALVAERAHGEPAMVELWGDNFAPTPMLTCVYRYFTTNAFHMAMTQEYWVPAIFERHDHVRCPIPAHYHSDQALLHDGSAAMPITATNDGVIYHYSNHSYVFHGCTWLGLGLGLDLERGLDI